MLATSRSACLVVGEAVGKAKEEGRVGEAVEEALAARTN